MSGQLGCKGNHVEVLELINRFSQRLIILVFNVQLVEGFIDRAEVRLLYRLHVGLSNLQSPVARATQLIDDPRVVDKLLQDLHQSREKHGVHRKVEVHRFVHDLAIAHLDDRIQEEIIVEGSGVLSHHLHRIVRLLISHVKVNSRAPQSGAFTGTHDLGHVELTEEHLAVLHDLLRDMLGVEDSELGEDANMGIFQAESLLKE
mmetsp:Transcript_57677/g.122373  ORF Transcript_57677/g.122373 Transcript_57677/m.122373 type:complete len:203 (+) Transcript_57677:726-1334(+)